METAPPASSRVWPSVAMTIAASPSRGERLLARKAPRAIVPKIARIVPRCCPVRGQRDRSAADEAGPPFRVDADIRLGRLLPTGQHPEDWQREQADPDPAGGWCVDHECLLVNTVILMDRVVKQSAPRRHRALVDRTGSACCAGRVPEPLPGQPSPVERRPVGCPRREGCRRQCRRCCWNG